MVMLLAALVQSLTGFGSALVAMSVLPLVVGIQVASPLVALCSLVLQVLLLLRYRDSFRFRAIWRLVIAGVLGIPIGIYFLKQADETAVLRLLGGLLVAYALYGLFHFRLPALNRPAWAYLAGFTAGLLGGAYNTSGPPVIIYSDAQGWERSQFKSNLQGFFLVIDLFIIAGHALGGNLTPAVWEAFLWSLPAIGLGAAAGFALDGRLNPASFRRLVLLLLLVMGINLLI